uniref:RING-type E3 ubiquitin transferase n=1 Tax=Hyaloperonospora arabidopsidis (strain Emoy2) TaxID=559515 RepID=M4BTA0_HYAAE
MGHTASTNRRQPRISETTLDEEPEGTAAASRGSYAPAQMQAVSTTRERPDMAFISTNDGVHKPIGLPELQQSSTITNHVNLNKSSLKLERSITEPSQYALTFKFDATKACRISVYLVAAEIVEAGTGNLSYALTYADKIPILAQHFSHGMRQTFVLKGGEKEEQTLTKDREKLEHPGSFLDFSGYDADDLVYKADERQFPLIIALEVVSDGKLLQLDFVAILGVHPLQCRSQVHLSSPSRLSAHFFGPLKTTGMSGWSSKKFG